MTDILLHAELNISLKNELGNCSHIRKIEINDIVMTAAWLLEEFESGVFIIKWTGFRMPPRYATGLSLSQKTLPR